MVNMEKWNSLKKEQPVFADFVKCTMTSYLAWLNAHTEEDSLPLGLEKSVKKVAFFMEDKKILCNSGAQLKDDIKTLIS